MIIDNNFLSNPYFDDLVVTAGKAGYEVSVDNSELHFESGDSEYPQFAPILTAKIYEMSGEYYFVPELSMPVCSGDDLKYADSFEYLAKLYEEAAKLATYISNYSFSSDEIY